MELRHGAFHVLLLAIYLSFSYLIEVSTLSLEFIKLLSGLSSLNFILLFFFIYELLVSFLNLFKFIIILVVDVWDFLLENLDLFIMTVLLMLHLSIKVLYLWSHLINLLLCDTFHIIDHIILHLEHVTPFSGLAKSVLQLLEMELQFFPSLTSIMILWLFLLLILLLLCLFLINRLSSCLCLFSLH